MDATQGIAAARPEPSRGGGLPSDGMRDTPPAAVIRGAREDDAPAIAAVVVEALSDKYGPALGRAAVRGLEGLIRRDIREGSSSRYWVAEVDGRVAGGVHLVLADDRGGGAIRALAASVGWATALRAVAVFSLMGGGRVDRDEGYIDELGVADWARRRGVASALLAACEREARRVGKRRLTLWVTSDNSAARPLYERYGFREARRRRWVLGRFVFGAPGAIFMEMSLPPR